MLEGLRNAEFISQMQDYIRFGIWIRGINVWSVESSGDEVDVEVLMFGTKSLRKRDFQRG